jgi:hypothetical protein
MEMTATPTLKEHTMYGRGHLRNSDSKRQVKKNDRIIWESWEVRLARWEAKQAEEAAKAKEASK